MLTLRASGEQRFGEWERSASYDDLNPAARTLSYGLDAACVRLTASEGVQQSSSSDSVLTVALAARRHQLPYCAPRNPVAGASRLPHGLLWNLSASISLSAQLQQLHTWNRFNIFQVARLTQHRPLYTVTLAIMDALGLLVGWKLDRRRVEAFLTAAEQAYGRGNHYHNSTHAADVVHASFILLRSVRQPQFSKLEVFSLLLSAVVHDIAHPGVTNDFLARTRHPIAMTHGSEGPNERHHLATAFSIISHASTDILAGFSPAEAQRVHGFVENAVLYTDMAKHQMLNAELEVAKVTLGRSLSSTRSRQRFPEETPLPSSAAAAADPPPFGDELPVGSQQSATQYRPLYRPSYDGSTASAGARQSERADAELKARQTLLYALLHAADLSNPARPLPIGYEWGHLVAREFLAQGDCEKRKGISVTPFCDRTTVVVATNQLKFIDMFLRPLLTKLEGVVGEDLMEQLLSNLTATVEYWQQQEARAKNGEAVDS